MHSLATLALSFALSPTLSTQDPTPPRAVAPPLASVVVDLGEQLEVEDLRAAGYDIVHVDQGERMVELLVPREQLRQLAASGLSHRVLTEDAAGWYAARSAAAGSGGAFLGVGTYGSWLTPAFSQGTMGGFYTLAETLSVLDQIQAAYPAIIAPRVSIGTSVEGRDIWMVKVSDNHAIDEGEPEVRIDSLHHAREPQGLHASLWFMLSLAEDYGTDPIATYLVDERELYFVPVVNPDGYEYNFQTNPGGGGLWRKNRRSNGGGSYGVDLNRNYPEQWGYDDIGSSPNPDSESYRGTSPASEPEVAAMVAFMAARDFKTALSIHTYGGWWLSPYGYEELYPANWSEFEELGDLVTEFNSYVHGPASVVLYTANGYTIDQDFAVHGTYSWAPEIGGQSDGFWPVQSRIVPLAEENRIALQRTALAAGPWVRIGSTTVLDGGDGDGYPEAGEPIQLTLDLRNSGLAAATNVSATLTAGPDLTVTDGTASFGNLAPFTSGDNTSDPLELVVGAAATAGSTIPYTIAIDADGLSYEIAGELTIGQPRLYIADDVELDLGWTIGLPSDAAVTGLWERADPIGTDGGNANPEDDTTPNPGVLCFTTGNGGGSVGNDDVDGDGTTLITPPFDLSQVAAPSISYDRWYYATGDDLFEVSISNDDGQSWVALEAVANDGEWRRVSFHVADYLVPTSTMRVRFVARDEPNNSIVEAAIDELAVEIFDDVPRLNAYGRPTLGDRVRWNVAAEPGAFVEIWASRFPGNSTIPGVTGTLLIHPDLRFKIAQGALPGSGLFSFDRVLPSNPVLVGSTFYFQAFVFDGPETILTNRDELTLE